ncbi:MAG: hypothetical protein NZ570_07765 [Candidatus Caldarchaeum sp.]|nr:hypothetical protein [Candidatus Caldarchaeum sp.]MCS7137379.1 hypothetical protein [Candidatus Caldarchaeum sp.]MDW8359247.1 hypothetical protein [Candidatus Caldarchaeum sp.]
METKFYVEVKVADKPLKADQAVLDAVKEVVKGKMLARMKKEYVDCPVEGSQVPFLSCFACVSHIRRVKGVVHCAGVERRLRA